MGVSFSAPGRNAVILAGALSFALVAYFGARSLYPPLRHPFRLVTLLSASTPNRLPVPVAGVVPRQLSDTWGAPRGRNRHHEGIDIFAPRNTPVLSSTEGIVLFTGWNRLGGRVITILGPGGYRHYYAHLERPGSQTIGDLVSIGDTVGYVGDSGNARETPTHLHYGIYRPEGRAVNPYQYLR
jgi:murein DD-endopeptidase MepM/ murein hydrolase activator NlpD